MWRPAHGATSRPGPCRPASGYGRDGGRPGPRIGDPVVTEPSGRASAPTWWTEGVDADAEAPAPVTP
jgi:hypothetical protein